MENDLVIYGDLMFDELLDLSNEEEMQMVSSETLVPSSWQKDAINSHPSPLADATATHTTPTPASNSSPHDATDFICDFDLDMAEMEWLSNFVEESFSPTAVEVHHPKVGGKSTTGDKPPNHQNDCVHAVHVEDELLYLTDSPLSVLENSMGILVSSALSPSSSVSSRTTSSTSCSGSTGIITKRPRLDVDDTSPLSGIGVEANLLVTTADHDQVDGGSSAGNYNNNENMKKSKKLKIKLSTPQQVGAGVANARKCLHCGMQKTPQWRAGPMGPKTLCNACGVRYKTGRLFPEYRPAASPTFVASVHSNSHKKVVEMRMRGDEEGGKKQVASKCCDLLNYIKGSNDWGFHEGRKEAKRSSRSLQQPATSDDESFHLS